MTMMTTMMTMTTAMMTTTMTDRSAARGMRHEYKHQISPQDDLVLSQRLRKLFSHDKNAGADGTYRITSLYFDTPDDGALREKLDGIGKREKFRLRYYGTFLSFRITLDRNIRTGLGSTDFLNGELFCAPVLEQGTVLEVKYDAFLPDLVRMAVQIPDRQAASCSKYALCRRFD